MQYILLIYGDETAGTAMSPEDQGKRLQEWDDYTQWLKDKNYYVGGDALHPTQDATTVRVRDGKTITTIRAIPVLLMYATSPKSRATVPARRSWHAS